MKRILILLAYFLLLCNIYATNIPSAKQGLLDLLKYDFDKNNSISLDGEWEFYWNKILNPEDFKENRTIPKDFIINPSKWNNSKIKSRKLDGTGFATYRLILKLNPRENYYGLKTGENTTAYNLWFNGILIFSNGKIATNKQMSIPEHFIKVIPLNNIKEENEIIMQVSNFYHSRGGVGRTPKIGIYEEVLRNQELNVLFQGFLIGSFFIIGLYHLVIFFLRKRNLSSILFSGFCFIIAWRTMVTGDYLITQIFPNINWEFLSKTSYLTFYLGVPIFHSFLYTLYIEEVSKKVLSIDLAVSAFFTILIISTNAMIYSQTIYVYEIICLLFIFVCIYGLIRAYRHKRVGAGIILIGVIFLSLASINDFLYNLVIIKTFYSIQLGLFVMILMQSIVLAINFSKAFESSEILSKTLNEKNKDLKNRENDLENANKELKEKVAEINKLNQELEYKVHERTANLETKNCELNSAIETIKTAQEQILSSEKVASLGRFAGGIAHEMNSPIAGVLTSAELMEIDIAELNRDNISEVKASLIDSLAIVKEGAKKSKDIISKLLKLTDFKNKRLEHTNISEIIKNCIYTQKSKFEENSISLTTIVENDYMVDVVPFEVFGAINNILDNSYDALIEKQGERRVIIKTYIFNGKKYVEIFDNGSGIEEGILKKIFDPFFTTKKIGTGMGLGLSIAYDMLKKNNFNINVESIKNEWTRVLLENK